MKTDRKELLEPIEEIREKEKQAVRSPSCRQDGRKSFSIEVIVKCILLQSVFNLSDSRLEEEIADRRSIQIFLGLIGGDSIPDETTIRRYKNYLPKRN